MTSVPHHRRRGRRSGRIFLEQEEVMSFAIEWKVA